MSNQQDSFDSLPDSGFITLSKLAGPVLSVSKATIRRWVAAGNFPQPVELSPGLHGYKVAHVRAWMASRRPAHAGMQALGAESCDA